MVFIYNVPFPAHSAAVLSTAPGNTRYGIEAQAASILVGQKVLRWTVRLRKAGAPSGNVTTTIRRSSDDAVVATFNETIDSTTLPTSYASFTFTLNTPYTIQSGDKLLIEYSGAVSVDTEVWLTDKIDGANTRRQRYDGTVYAGGNTNDIAGTIDNGIGAVGIINSVDIIPRIELGLGLNANKMFSF